MLDAAPDTVEYVPAAQTTHPDWLVAEVKTEYVPDGQAWQAEADVARSSDDQVPALQF